jgi:hypothetical protein
MSYLTAFLLAAAASLVSWGTITNRKVAGSIPDEVTAFFN